jgi:serine/threonine-protein kinase
MVMPELPGGIAAAIDMALRFKKEDRWQSVDAMRRAFREARDLAGLGRPAEPVRAFDMSLDESTHVDKGGPSQLPPAFDGDRTQRLVSEPPEGPSGTFIGIGDREGKMSSVVGNDGSVPPPPGFVSTPPHSGASRPPMRSTSNAPPLPARARMPSHAGTPGVPFQPTSPSGAPQPPGVLVASSRPSPAAVVRHLPTPEPINIRSSRPEYNERTEGSIPAYGNTLNFGADESVGDIDPRDVGMRPKSSVGVWLMAVLLAAAALGGIAFFAVKRAPQNNNDSTGAGGTGIPATTVSSATPAPPQPTSMLPSSAVTPPPSTGVETSAGTVTVVKDAAAATPTPPAITPTPPARPAGAFPWRPQGGGGGGHAPRNPSRPAPPPTNDTPTTPSEPPKPMPPGLAPDPFGTPE